MAPLMHRRWQRNFRRASEIAGAEVRRGHQLSVTSVALCDANVLGHSTSVSSLKPCGDCGAERPCLPSSRVQLCSIGILHSRKFLEVDVPGNVRRSCSLNTAFSGSKDGSIVQWDVTTGFNHLPLALALAHRSASSHQSVHTALCAVQREA